MIKVVDDIQRVGMHRSRDCSRAGETEALKQIDIELEYLVDFLRRFESLCDDEHLTRVCVGDDICHDLLLIRVSVDAADDREVDLDVFRRELQKILFTAVAASVVIQGEGAGKAGVPLLTSREAGSSISSSVISMTICFCIAAKRRQYS